MPSLSRRLFAVVYSPHRLKGVGEPLSVTFHPKKNRYARDGWHEGNQQHNFHLGSDLREQLNTIAISKLFCRERVPIQLIYGEPKD